MKVEDELSGACGNSVIAEGPGTVGQQEGIAGTAGTAGVADSGGTGGTF